MGGKILDFCHSNANCDLITDCQRREQNSIESDAPRNGVHVVVLNSSHVQLGLAHTNGVRCMARVHMPHPPKFNCAVIKTHGQEISHFASFN